MIDIYLATSNPHKIEEIRSCMSSYFKSKDKKDPGIQLHSSDEVISEFDCNENGKSFEENALIKARFLKSKLNGKSVSVLADDSGLQVLALNNEPGIYSARYSSKGSDEANNQKLLKNMEGIKNREARFCCVIAYIDEKDKEYIFKGYCEGTILEEFKGTSGFGYDPLFLVNDLGKTYAQLRAEEKDKVSHRGVAIRNLLDFLDSRKNI